MRGYKNFEGTPHPGDLCHMVEIGYTENTINENGYPEPKDVVLCRVWASAIDAGNQHYRAADVMNTEQVINFTIRYRKDIKPGMWVIFQDEKWIISTLGEYSFKRTYLGLKASIAKGVSGYCVRYRKRSKTSVSLSSPASGAPRLKIRIRRCNMRSSPAPLRRRPFRTIVLRDTALTSI